jgi:hypothetical protein
MAINIDYGRDSSADNGTLMVIWPTFLLNKLKLL